MVVAVMHVRHMFMLVLDRGVPMYMDMRLAGRMALVMSMRVMLIVRVRVLVLDRLVLMAMGVTRIHEYDDSRKHQRRADCVHGSRSVVQKQDRRDSAYEWCGREDGRFPGRAEFS